MTKNPKSEAAKPRKRSLKKKETVTRVWPGKDEIRVMSDRQARETEAIARSIIERISGEQSR